MNYYERHIGDYLKDTAHLSLLEHGIYTRLLDVYYTRESALPDDQVARLIGARSKDEKDALQAVLGEFFELRDGMRVQDRCDREIERYLDKQAKARTSALAGVAARRGKSGDVRADRMVSARSQGTHTTEQWTALLTFCGNKCVKCGATGSICKDHILPVYQGGSDSIDNLQPLCKSCNSAKGPESVDYRLSEWRAFVERSLSVRLAPRHQTPDTNPKGIRGATAPLPPAAPAPGGAPALELTGDPATIPPCPLKQLVGLFVAKVPQLPKPRYELWATSKGADAMRQRWKWLLSPEAVRDDGSRYATTAGEGVEWFGRFFDTVAASDFLSGRNDVWKNCDLTWLMNKENFMKVVQGNYDNKGTPT